MQVTNFQQMHNKSRPPDRVCVSSVIFKASRSPRWSVEKIARSGTKGELETKWVRAWMLAASLVPHGAKWTLST